MNSRFNRLKVSRLFVHKVREWDEENRTFLYILKFIKANHQLLWEEYIPAFYIIRYDHKVEETGLGLRLHFLLGENQSK